jgi:hypothetical protein
MRKEVSFSATSRTQRSRTHIYVQIVLLPPRPPAISIPKIPLPDPLHRCTAQNELHAHPHFRVPTTSHRVRLASGRAGSHKGPGWQLLDQGTSMPSGLSSPRARMS